MAKKAPENRMQGTLARIVDGGLCHGCGACAAAVGAGKIEMSVTPAGYLRPRALRNLGAADEEIVRRVCSGRELVQSRSGDSPYDPSWGPMISVETGHSTDPEVRYLGSSGGVMSAIAVHLLETGTVDFVLQTAADPADPIGNVWGPSRNRADVLAAAGSRYAPSAPLAGLEAHLSRGRRFAFIGKPCDVASLRRMARYDPRIDRLIPFKLSFFCAGTPSRTGAQAIVSKLGVAEKDLAKFAFRGRGWPGWARAVRHDGSEEKMDYNSSWGSILSPKVQFRCKVCVDGTGEFADIACADAWYGKDGYPDFTERDGRSLIIARTAAGQALLDALSAAGKLVREAVPIDEISKMQPHQFTRKRAVLVRIMAMRLRGFTPPRYKRFQLTHLTLRSSPLWLLRNFLGTFLRIGRSGHF